MKTLAFYAWQAIKAVGICLLVLVVVFLVFTGLYLLDPALAMSFGGLMK